MPIKQLFCVCYSLPFLLPSNELTISQVAVGNQRWANTCRTDVDFIVWFSPPEKASYLLTANTCSVCLPKYKKGWLIATKSAHLIIINKLSRFRYFYAPDEMLTFLGLCVLWAFAGVHRLCEIVGRKINIFHVRELFSQQRLAGVVC